MSSYDTFSMYNPKSLIQKVGIDKVNTSGGGG